MAFGWIKNLFGKKDKKGMDNQIHSVYENPFYESAENEAENPFFQDVDDFIPQMADNKPDYSNVGAIDLRDNGENEKIEGSEGGIEPKVNLLTLIGEMPTKESICEMTGGIQMWKMKFFSKFSTTLDFLEEYQDLMQQSHSASINDAKMRRMERYTTANAKFDSGKDEVEQAFICLKNFIIHAEDAVNSEKGFFASRSSNVRKMNTIFGNLLVQAYEILPKLAYLDTQVAPYVMATDRDTYTLSDVLHHQVSASRSGGLAMRSADAENSFININPDKVLNVLKGNDSMKGILQLRMEKTTQARMNLKIPSLPVGVLKERAMETVGDERIKNLEKDAENIASAYIQELRLLTIALDDTAESNEFNGEGKERAAVHDKQAEHFRISRLLYRIIQNKKLLKQLIINGYLNDGSNQPAGYSDMMKIDSISGMTLSSAATLLNEEAMDESKFVRLVDREGNNLVEEKDYHVGGGKLSISILDFKNQKVLRATKNNEGKHLNAEEQKHALNGILDEAAGKVSQFLGFNVSAQAEAAGFMAKGEGETHETAVFGGSIMEMAKGIEAKKINLMMGDGKENLLREDRRDEKFTNLNVFKQGRLLGEIMKMQVMDYIIMHGDRNLGNFMINLEAGENEAMVTAIDNDMLFGNNAGARDMGHDASKDALIGINDKGFMDFGNKLTTAFPMMTQEVKDKLKNLDVDALNELLMPYADRVSRRGAVHRAIELKALAEKVPTCDLTKEEDVRGFVNAVAKNSTIEWVKQMNVRDGVIDKASASIKFLPSTLVRMIIDPTDKNKLPFYDEVGVLNVMKKLGLSKEEAEGILREHLSKSMTTDEKLIKDEFKDEFKETEFYKHLQKYDEL